MHRLVNVLFLGLATAAGAEEAPLASVYGRTHDDVAQCLMLQMPPHLRAWPRVSPPPSQEAVVNVFVRGHDQAEDPVGVFQIRPSGSGALAISFNQFSGVRGEYDRIARVAAQRCAR